MEDEDKDQYDALKLMNRALRKKYKLRVAELKKDRDIWKMHCTHARKNIKKVMEFPWKVIDVLNKSFPSWSTYPIKTQEQAMARLKDMIEQLKLFKKEL